LNTDSGNAPKSVQLETRIGVQLRSESLFRLNQNRCSGWARICNRYDLLLFGYFNEWVKS
jgi:hypothetical protein